MDDNMKNDGFISNSELKALGEQVHALASRMLEHINQRSIRLFDLPAHKRIFLFILTRAMKSFSAIEILCHKGYGQDVASLLRSLMESLITVRYIMIDPDNADELARRFVEYKWIIFRRTLAEEELALRTGTEQQIKDFEEKKALILENVQTYKRTYGIRSDRALLTWSGKTLKDMARAISKELHHEYEKTFRQCSRFSHPTILGDKEYMIQDDKSLSFSPQASGVGVETNCISSILYFLLFLSAFNDLFDIGQKGCIDAAMKQCHSLRRQIEATKLSPPGNSAKKSNIRQVKIHFKY